MIFHEIYSLYYKTVACLIQSSFTHVYEIINENAFKESFMMLEEALERWLLDNIDVSTYPLTLLQKRWLKAISLDPRMQLFSYSWSFLDDVEPLFTPNDIYMFDQYSDGDPYTDLQYQKNFHMIMQAIKEKSGLAVTWKTKQKTSYVLPQLLEYSEKDDKFRLVACDGTVINVSRIEECHLTDHNVSNTTKQRVEKYVLIELKNERNTLDRVLLHFAHFKKETEKKETEKKENTYIVKLFYDESDEPEMVIRLLSFGPMIKVIKPLEFKQLIRQRLKKQKEYSI